MQYQTALSLLMEQKQISIKTLVKLTNVSERWIEQILKKQNWNPWLDTVIKISDALKINPIQFIEFAETREFPKKKHLDPVKITPTSISSTLKNIRIQKGLSQTDLVKLTHFQLSSISLRENSRYQSFPTLSTLEIYCKAFEISVSSFLLISNKTIIIPEGCEI
ncbi:helix-turn-helix transcriptional regulator [Sphaerochaeta sp. PS]|uniref:helix-turn-helix transcriptional regulator n=1 Tax=Sphaerochaeta sp. PS TaxID=3076336 RepID=UPI0028A37581|nr:helix-turn-helix transcriptional regulator [Sphaerochaeta sp. PS]MDT4761168.1 helix-turn-helix transcriptional regulator [Sphaerochaeta sp. PS]